MNQHLEVECSYICNHTFGFPSYYLDTHGNHLVLLFLPLLLVQQKGLKIALVASVDWNTLEV
jgi:hypothetical protein